MVPFRPSSVRCRLYAAALFLGLVVTAQSACSSSKGAGADCEEGSEGCSCYPNRSCDAGLECHSDLCVEEGSSSSGSGGSKSGGSGGDSGGSSSGGSSGGSGGSRSDAGGSSSDAGGSSSDSGGSSSDSGGSSSGGSANCETGERGCSCYPNNTCNDDLVCKSAVCVSASTTSNGGAGGSDGTGGASTNSGGSAGTGGTGGGATNGTGGTGGSEPDPSIIDDFASCDGVISPVDGRDGGWFAFGDDDVNVLPPSDVGAQPPPSDFQDLSCAAWYTTGCGATADYCSFAGLGFVFFEDESPYDLSDYQALRVRREGDAQWVVVHMSGGLAFGVSLAAGLGTSTLYFDDFVPSGDTDPYAIPNWSKVTKIEFTSLAPEGSGLAIYDIRLL